MKVIVLLLGFYPALLLAALPPPAPTDAYGEQVAAELNRRYHSFAQDCDSPSAPAFLCSGVLLRATTVPQQTDLRPWNPVLPNNYGVSFSYLRQDSLFPSLATGGVNGFIFHPILGMPPGKLKIPVLCIFPTKAQTELRSEGGCGPHRDFPTQSRMCHQQGLTTANQWLTHFRSNTAAPYAHQCGFGTLESYGHYATENFNAALLAHRNITPQFNEVRLETWEKDIAGQLPVEAFFYLEGSNGGPRARRDQLTFMTISGGQVKPVVRLKLPNSSAEQMPFSYFPADQAVPPIPDPAPAPFPRSMPRRCATYISTAQWINRSDGISLAVTPSDCARDNLPAADHAFAVDELFDRWASDSRFTNPKGMRDQFLCHLKNAPGEAQWNLEPWRPNVGIAKTEASYCNP